MDVSEYSAVSDICELATLRSYYHNVAVYEEKPSGAVKVVSDILTWPFNNLLKTGYKQFWLEYSGIVEIGIDDTSRVGSTIVQRTLLDSLSFLQVCSLDGGDIRRAATLAWDDFDACLIYQAALKTKADRIITHRPHAFKEQQVCVITPEELLTELRGEIRLVDEGEAN